MATATKQAPPKHSPFQDWLVYSPNTTYTGVSAKQEFVAGKAQVPALPYDACVCPDAPRLHVQGCRVVERIQQLQWLANAGYRIAPGTFMREAPMVEVGS